MTAIVDVDDTRTNFSKVLARVHAGEEIILAKTGKPFAKLVPIAEAPKPRRQPGRFKDQLGDVDDSVWFDPLPQPLGIVNSGEVD